MDIFYCVPRLIIFCRALWMTSSQVIKLMGYLAWKCVHRIMHIFASCLMSEDVCWVRYLCSGWSPFYYWVASVVLVFINLMAECVLFCNVLLIRNCIITDTACIVGVAESVKRYCICLVCPSVFPSIGPPQHVKMLLWAWWAGDIDCFIAAVAGECW